MMLSRITLIMMLLVVFTTHSLRGQVFSSNNPESNLSSFNTINGQWYAITPSNNTFGFPYYQGLNFGFDLNNYVSLMNGVSSNDLYFGRWQFGWKGWNKIWHSGNLNNTNIDFSAKNINIFGFVRIGDGSNSPGSAGNFVQNIGVGWENAFIAERAGTQRWSLNVGSTGNDFVLKVPTSEKMRVTASGNVGIGTSSPTSKLEVNGTIRAQEIKVEATNWPDYVFAPDYELMNLKAVSEYIQINKHLPGIPSEKEVQESGILLGEMNALLLKKIEELTLYIIKQQEQIDSLLNK